MRSTTQTSLHKQSMDLWSQRGIDALGKETPEYVASCWQQFEQAGDLHLKSSASAMSALAPAKWNIDKPKIRGSLKSAQGTAAPYPTLSGVGTIRENQPSHTYFAGGIFQEDRFEGAITAPDSLFVGKAEFYRSHLGFGYILQEGDRYFHDTRIHERGEFDRTGLRQGIRTQADGIQLHGDDLSRRNLAKTSRGEYAELRKSNNFAITWPHGEHDEGFLHADPADEDQSIRFHLSSATKTVYFTQNSGGNIDAASRVVHAMQTASANAAAASKSLLDE